MSSLKKMLVICAALTLLLLGAGPSWSKEKVSVAMILWRGMTDAEEGFQTRLRESDKYDFQFALFDAEQDKGKLAKIIEGLDIKKYRLIYSFGSTVTIELQKKFKEIPIVFNIVARPIEAGIIKSWENSGNNITGVSNAVPMASVFSTLSKVMKITRLGFIYNPKEINAVIQRDEADQLQKRFGYVFVPAPIESDKSIPGAIDKLAKAKVDAVLLPSDSLVKDSGNDIVGPLNKLKIPTIASIPDMVTDNKAFLGLGPGYVDLGKMAGEKALAIVGGEKPGNIASGPLDRLHITVNLATSKQIGVSVPVQILRISTAIR